MKMKILILLAALALAMPIHAVEKDKPISTTRLERKHIRAGNKLFERKDYANAEVEYKKALEVAPHSPIAKFNLATVLLLQGGNAGNKEAQNDENNPIRQAADILTDLAKNAPTASLRSKANYDLGNLAYLSEQYAQAVQLYKQALRNDPDDDQARYNLRMAQLKLKNQQDQNKNQNKDQNKNQNKDQNKDKQDQNKDKQDQNKDKQDQNKDQQDQNKDQQDQNKNQQQQPQQGMSKQNAEQVLKAMQNQENATQQRVGREQALERQQERNRTNRKW